MLSTLINTPSLASKHWVIMLYVCIFNHCACGQLAEQVTFIEWAIQQEVAACNCQIKYRPCTLLLVCWYITCAVDANSPQMKNHLDDTTSRHNIQFSTSFSTLEVTSVTNVITWTFLKTLFICRILKTEQMKWYQSRCLCIPLCS